MPTKIWIPLTLMIGGISWLAFTNLGKANYFFPVDELPPAGDSVYNHSLKVKGRIVVGSIIDDKKPVIFTIHEKDKEMVVHYVGEEPLPDMFKDRAETVVEGMLRADGVFEAVNVQAKCASKYEAEAPDVNANAYDQPASPDTI